MRALSSTIWGSKPPGFRLFNFAKIAARRSVTLLARAFFIAVYSADELREQWFLGFLVNVCQSVVDLLGLFSQPQQGWIGLDREVRVGKMLRGVFQCLEPGLLDLQVVPSALQLAAKPSNVHFWFRRIPAGQFAASGPVPRCRRPQFLSQLLESSPAAAQFRFFFGVKAIQVIQPTHLSVPLPSAISLM